MQAILVQAIDMFFNKFLTYALIARIFISWLPSLRQSAIGSILYSLTEPILSPIRGLIYRSPIGMSYLDFSAVIALFLIRWLSYILMNLVVTIV